MELRKYDENADSLIIYFQGAELVVMG